MVNKIEIDIGLYIYLNDKIYYVKFEVSLVFQVKGLGKLECSLNKLLGYFDDGNIKVDNV